MIDESKEIGATMPDGTIFAGLTPDGRQEVYAMPTDLNVTMTFNEAAKAVKQLNDTSAFGHDDWQIPSLDEALCVLLANSGVPDLRGTFTMKATHGSEGPDWPDSYWSSTEYRNNPSAAWVVRFSDGFVGWLPKDDFRTSCRPVRLVDVPKP